MKKILSLLLTLSLLLLPFSALSESDTDAPTPLPEIGGVIHGFELKETHDYPLIGAMFYRFEHQRTGAEVFYCAADDLNRVFDLVFRTEAIDDTGLPHVFEHATLAGSKKYPSKDLWFNLANGSFNTYMNAYTASNHTAYPVASLSEDQLLKFADFYTDCCLNPMVMEDESIFREEAWRYRLNAPEDPLILEGTVYSEMQGSLTLESRAYYNNARLLMPGSYVGNVSGGDPDFIPDMTFEDIKAYHDKYYHPSNCVAFLYGRLEHYDRFLELLDAAFAPFERREYAFDDPNYTPIDQPAEASFTFPVEAGSPTEDMSSITYSFLLPGLMDDKEEFLRMQTLAVLLNDSGSTMSRAVEEQLPAASWGCGLSTDGPEPFFSFGCYNCNPEDMQTFKAIVDGGLSDLAENPFPQDMLDAQAAQLEIAKRLIGESTSMGTAIAGTFAQSYIDTGDPWLTLDSDETLGKVDGWNREGVYGELAKKYLVGSQQTALTCTSPAPGEKEQKDAELAEKLAAIKAAMSDEEIAAIVEASNATAEPNPDTAAMLEALTAVTVQSLPVEEWVYPITDITGEDGTRRLDATAAVEGIGIPVVLLDVADLPQEDIHWFHLFADIIGEVDTGSHTHEELDTLWDRYLCNGETALTLLDEDDELRPRLSLEWLALDADLAKGYDLMWEITYDSRFEDTQRISERVNAYLNGMRAAINDGAYEYEAVRALGMNEPAMCFSAYYDYIDYYDFLRDVAGMCESDPAAVTAKLNAMRDIANNASNAIIGYAGSSKSIALNRELADGFLQKLDRREVTPAVYDLPSPAAREAVVVDTPVQYNGIVADFETLGIEDSEELSVVTQLVNDLYLLPELRTRYGAYGVTHATVDEYGLQICSYRDPTVKEAFEVYEGLPDFLENLELDQQALDRYIINTYQGYLMDTGELTGAIMTLNLTIGGYEQGEDMEDMRALKALTPEKVKGYVDMYRKLIEKGARFTVGGASVIDDNAELYDAVLNPFGQVNRLQQALTDVTEDRPDHKAIRYVYEEELMDAMTGDTFGVDAPATTGDLACALNQVISEDIATPEQAVENLAMFGILSPNDRAGDTLTARDCGDIITNLSALIGMEYPGEVKNADPFTRADLAVALCDFFQWLDSQMAEAA